MRMQRLRILIVEDNEADQALIALELKKSGLSSQLEYAETRQEFLTQAKQFDPDIILCDFSLPQFNALDVLALVPNVCPGVPVIIITGTLSDETAVECLKQGAADYILKNKILRLPSAIERTMELKNSRREKEEVELRLHESEKQLRAVIDTLPAFLAYLDDKFKVVFCNKTSVHWFGLSEEKLQGQYLGDLVGKGLSDLTKKKAKEVQKGETISFENSIRYKGVERFVSVNLTSAELDNEVRGYVCLMTDISSRKQYEEELRVAKEEADSANKAKSQFLTNMSHEMRTPLSAMLGFTELLSSSDQSETERRTWVGKIRASCEHLKVMIDEILDLSKVEAGKLEVDISQFALADIIEEVRSLLFPLAKEKNIELKFSVADKIPTRVETDPIKLKHIIINIVGNAIKFCDKGPIDVVIGLIYDPQRHPLLAFTVADKGLGMSEEQSRRLFKPFSQVDNSITRKYGGTGLGLVIARKFARALGGDVDLLSSQPKEGSRFLITINPGRIDQAPFTDKIEGMFTSESSPPELSSDFDLSKMKVLLVEDSPENQFLVQKFLEKVGIVIDIASNGLEGIEFAQNRHYDLILMDIQMPVLDGYDATSRLRASGYTKPIVALTAHALKAERERCLSIGFDDYFTKPIKRQELLKGVARFQP